MADAQKKPVKKNPHAGHRERMRQRVRAHGFDGFAEHEILEYMLFHVIRRGNTNEIGHALIDAFGSVNEVLRADYDELVEVPGVGPACADYILYLRELYLAFDRYSFDGASLDNAEVRCAYFLRKLDMEQDELLLAACLDDTRRVKHQFVVARGSIGKMYLSHHDLLKGVLQSHCRLVVLAHNHPEGQTIPSYEDIDTTVSIARALHHFDIEVLDHIIVAQGKAISMLETGAYSPLSG
ncbi:MAG: DNA repair protein RadC [Oscillospiraceae bacterium]|nr:DNA repair protein RadC [Oscillospiraceae bacterium]